MIEAKYEWTIFLTEDEHHAERALGEHSPKAQLSILPALKILTMPPEPGRWDARLLRLASRRTARQQVAGYHIKLIGVVRHGLQVHKQFEMPGRARCLQAAFLQCR